MQTILFLHNVNTSWVDRDREILGKENKVINFYAKNPLKYLSFSWVVRVAQSDAIFCWFASFSFFPVVALAKILGKKVLVVSGGFDAARFEPIGYGAFTKSTLSRYLRRKLFSFADKILCVSKANMAETIINAEASGAKCELIYHGFEEVDVDLKPFRERKNQVVMISQCDHTTYYRKGIDQFLKIAELMPEYSFVLVGRVHKDIEILFRETAPPNFRYTGFLKFRGPEFASLLNDSKFITQLSLYESFGCSIIDGVQYGCYPISTSSFALFEVTKDIGLTCAHGDLDKLRETLVSTSSEDVNVNVISKKVYEIFPYSKRCTSLLKVVSNCKG